MDRPAQRFPDFYIAGDPRCGTTFLYGALRRHPDVFMPERKELHYFASDLDRGTEAEGHFRIRDEATYLRMFQGARPGQLVGEASTSYLASTVAIERIAAVAPGARIIAALRDPIEQIASTHARLTASGHEHLDLAAALEAEPDRLAGRLAMRRERFPVPPRYRAHARYGKQLERVLRWIPRDRVLVVLLDDVARDAAAQVRRVTDFLGLAELGAVDGIDRNANRVARSKAVLEAVWSPRTIGAAKRLVPARLHGAAGGLADRIHRLNRREVPRPPVDRELRDRLTMELRADLERASELLGEDLVARWWGSG